MTTTAKVTTDDRLMTAKAMTTTATRAVVVGAGPGGYVAAIRLAQLGVSTVLVDRAPSLGGVCLNSGCIPSKALIHASKLIAEVQAAGEMGIGIEKVKVDLKKMIAWKNGIVDRLTKGIGALLAKRKVEVVQGDARFLDATRRIEVTAADGSRREIPFDHAIIASGSRSIEIPGFEFDGQKVLSSRSALDLTSLPKSMAILGGGVIGLEIGTVFAKFGTEVTVIELLDQLLPGTDPELVGYVSRELKKKKVAIHLATRAKSCDRSKNGVRIEAEGPKGPLTVQADLLLVTVGRRPNTEKLGLDKAGVATTPKGFVAVNEKMETNVPGIYAIGDCAGPPLLAHKASKEGMVAAERIAGLPSVADWKAMPAATFTDPEVATTGLQEHEAKAKGIEVRVGRFPYQASGRALSTNQASGIVKVIARPDGVVLGGAIAGAQASDLIAEITLAIEMGAHLDDLALTVHAHPTLPEMTMEAAEVALGHAIHVPG